MFVVQRSDGVFVSNDPDRGSSYVSALQNAKIFPTWSDAEKDCCPGNEHVVSVYEILKPSKI